jgi:pentafunctional AROM polypeptide
LTPVTHPLLPGLAAPGQLSYAQVQQGLHLLGLSPRKTFHIFGSPVSHSRSPIIHNTGFQVLGLPHFYDTYDCSEVDQGVIDRMNSPSFGGASVTMPMKLPIIPLLHHVSDDAKAIGAVNTVIPRIDPATGKRVFHGDNTDWRAMRDLISKTLAQVDASIDTELVTATHGPLTGLVLGAGGTSRAAIYALHHIGVKIIYIFNRTPANIVKLIDAFPKNFNLVPLTALDQYPLGLPRVVINTIPAENTTTSHIEAAATGKTFIPELVLEMKPAGVLVDLSYKPRVTPLSLIAEQKGWAFIGGLEILLQQGFHQFKLWTGKHAPEAEITEAIRAADAPAAK